METHNNCDLKLLLDNYKVIGRMDRNDLEYLVDNRVDYIVNLYNSSPNNIKTELKKRLGVILYKTYGSKIPVWPNIIDKLIIHKLCKDINNGVYSLESVLILTILFEIELKEASNINNLSSYEPKYMRDKLNMKMSLLYNNLSDNDKIEVKLWILDYLRKDEDFGKEVIDKYLLPEVDIYSIVKLSKKNPDGEKFITKLFRKLIGITVESESEKKK